MARGDGHGKVGKPKRKVPIVKKLLLLEPDVAKRIRCRVTKSISANQIIVDALEVYLDIYRHNLVVVKNGNDYIWISQNGYTGPIDKVSLQKILKGAINILDDKSEDWTETFDNMEDAVNSLGTPILQTLKDRSIKVTDTDALLTIINKIK